LQAKPDAPSLVLRGYGSDEKDLAALPDQVGILGNLRQPVFHPETHSLELSVFRHRPLFITVLIGSFPGTFQKRRHLGKNTRNRENKEENKAVFHLYKILLSAFSY